jgi:hypothetical protein
MTEDQFDAACTAAFHRWAIAYDDAVSQAGRDEAFTRYHADRAVITDRWMTALTGIKGRA